LKKKVKRLIARTNDILFSYSDRFPMGNNLWIPAGAEKQIRNRDLHYVVETPVDNGLNCAANVRNIAEDLCSQLEADVSDSEDMES
jgi:hypothetical protein